MRKRFGRPALAAQRICERDVRLHVVGLILDGRFEMRNRVINPALRRQENSKAVMSFGRRFIDSARRMMLVITLFSWPE